MFFVNGAAGASWFVRIPDVQHALGATPAELGGALLGGPLGSLFGVPFAGWLVGRISGRTATISFALACCLAVTLPPAVPNLVALGGSLFLLGFCYGGLDMCMNAEAVGVERLYRRPLMSSFHAQFSVGGIVGAFVGGAVAARGVPALAHLQAAAVTLGLAAVLAGPFLLTRPAGSRAATTEPTFARPPRALLGLGIFAFCALLSEGAVADWSAVYLRSIGADAQAAAAGYGIFSLTMAGGRLAGDRLTLRLGPVRLSRIGGSVAAIGLGFGLIVGMPRAALVGFGLMGAGLATLFPMALSAAGRTPHVRASAALAAVTTVGYSGMLLGPPLIGGLAQLVTLPVALGLVVILCATSAALAGATRVSRSSSS
jgi:MFS family permease